MVEKPILFSTPMVQAILENRKSMTRRVVASRIADRFVLDSTGKLLGSYRASVGDVYPTVDDAPYEVGDVLWVRETWERLDCSSCEGDFTGRCFNEPDKNDGCYVYRATHDIAGDARWHPSIHMPREAARLFICITGVKIESVQDITEEDARCEGAVKTYPYTCSATGKTAHMQDENGTFRDGFACLWDFINTKRGYGWDANPWVWVYEFNRMEVY